MANHWLRTPHRQVEPSPTPRRLEKEGSDRARVTADTKAKAIEKMRAYMGTREGSVRIRKENGQLQEERTYPRSKGPLRSPG